jgi:hypothetical protein
MYTHIRARRTWKSEGHILYATHALAWVVEIEHPFRNVNLAPPSGLELKESQRELQSQGKVRCELVLAAVGLEVQALHLLHGQIEMVSRHEALTQVVPSGEREFNLALQISPLVLERRLRIPCIL